MSSTERKVLWFVIAFLLSVIAGLLVGYLSYSQNARTAVLAGLAAFGGTLVGVIAIESKLGLW